MTSVFYASTLFGAMTLATALDAGAFGDHDERRVLIVSNTVPIPEITPSFDRLPAAAGLRERFDDVVDWNALVAPLHPSRWRPRAAEAPMLARLFAQRLGLAGGVRELVLESVAVAPARTIGSLLQGCPITVYSDGLMSYGPTRDNLPAGIGRRTSRLLYLDLVPTIAPLLLREYDVATVALPDTGFRRVVASLPAADAAGARGAPVVLGQYLSQLGILEPREELELHERMLDALAARGADRVVFRPHPAARRVHVLPLQRHAQRRGVELVVPDDGLPAESWFAAAGPSLVVSCFSTALFTASRFYGCEVATMGTDTVLERVAPFENSNRIPVTLADALLPRLDADGGTTRPDVPDVTELVRAVGYCMQADRLADLRDAAAAYLGRHGRERYFKRKRLEAVGLLAPPPAAPAPTAPPVGKGLLARAGGRRPGGRAAAGRAGGPGDRPVTREDGRPNRRRT
ncbi:hypothetical protein SAMN05443575_2413 [Jatrophihabitans endophyticus]|uniref:Capsule polysaccharide biosynthesis protein n=1 Tax=Jatrophihabitans endophyticus TaxID=1206085 RepID=A0A1M5LCB6_9ACTN|nr:polysialyltransferase family glycosyltransferase [Jatrophihabitans endophyticus]SHG62742.1 hypothetical protein SAMN05443575_2413 [Jatrophihabitans endophyticus]